MSLDTQIGDTLALVNQVRLAFGYEELFDLPDARMGETTDCLYYRALKDVGCTGVGGSTLHFNSERKARVVAELWGTSYRGGHEIEAPRSVAHVISQFDGNHTPHYNV